jgi:hypothetical protein
MPYGFVWFHDYETDPVMMPQIRAVCGGLPLLRDSIPTRFADF